MPRPDDHLNTRLATLDRDQLEALVRRLVNRQPDLVDLVHLPLPGEARPADGRHIVAQVTEILVTMGDDWRASTRAEAALWPLVELGVQYLNRGALADAHTVFASITTTILAHYEQVRDQESEIAGIVGQCVEELGRCLAATTDIPSREALLRDVFAIYRWDTLGRGGYGMDEAPRRLLLSATNPTERALVAGWVRQVLTAPPAHVGRWGRRNAGRLVLDLVGSDLNTADREQLFTAAELDGPRLELLLAQGRHDEAVRLVQHIANDGLLGLADRLVTEGLVDEAREAVRDHLAVLDPRNHRVRDWLTRQGVALPSNLDALLAAITRFKARPGVRAYQDMRQEAVAARCWPKALVVVGPLDVHRKALQPVRARRLADLGDAAGALAELEGLTGSTWKRTAVDVAAGLEGSHPAVAADLLRGIVDGLLKHGTKPARTLAAELGARLAALEQRLG